MSSWAEHEHFAGGWSRWPRRQPESSPERFDGPGHDFLLVEQKQHRPTVEGRARMRDAQRHQVADSYLIVGSEADERVLVAQRRDCGPPQWTATRAGWATPSERGREARIVREIAPTGIEQHEVWLGPGHNAAPDLQGGPEGLEPPARQATRRTRRIETVVVGDIAAASQYHGRVDAPGSEDLRDHVEEQAPTGRHNRVIGQQAFGGAPLVRVGDALNELAHTLLTGTIPLRADRSLVSRDPGKLDSRRGGHLASQRDRLVVVAQTGAPPGMAELDQEPCSPVGLEHGVASRMEALDTVDVPQQLDILPVSESVRQPRQCMGV